MTWQVLVGDALTTLQAMPPESVQCCVTSPPYWGLRDYGVGAQIGREKTPEAYVVRLVEVFREVRRVLRQDGTLWLNLGDSFAGPANGGQGSTGVLADRAVAVTGANRIAAKTAPGLRAKELVGIPWRVAFALQADGWYLRSDIIWHKLNPMPESVRDRPTRAHEYLFLLTKSARYFYDADAVAEEAVFPAGPGNVKPTRAVPGQRKGGNANLRGSLHDVGPREVRNRRSVWAIPTQPYSGAHFAVFPPKLVEPCILAGSRPGDTVLDPFAGAATTGLVALRLQRSFVGIEINPAYASLAKDRLRDDAPLYNLEAK